MLTLGFAIGFPLTGLIFGMLGYVVWILIQIRKLGSWLDDPESKEPPELRGIFEVLLDRALRVNREHQREAQKLRTALSRQNRLFSGVRDAVMLVDQTNNVAWFNKQASELLHLRPSSDIGIPLGNVIRTPRFFSYFEAEEYAEPIVIRSPRNADTGLEVAISKYEHGDKILVFRDVTRMQKLEQTRSDFIANLSHEMRTPLTVLRGYLETLFLQPAANDAVKRIYQEMDNQAERMTQLVKDLATLSRLESADASRQDSPVNVSSMLTRVIKDAKSLASYDGHVFVEKISPDFWLTAVENELYSAFSNLAFNAVRHTPANTKITIVARPDKKPAYIEFSDNGPGIDPKHLPRITERFYRVDASRNSGTGGTGLGLAIVKHAIGAQGGQLIVTSTPGKGASFRCEFPPALLCGEPSPVETD